MNNPIFINFFIFNRESLDSDWERISEEEVRDLLQDTVQSVHGTESAMQALFAGKTVRAESFMLHAAGLSVPKLATDEVHEIGNSVFANVASAEDINDLLF